MEIIQENGKDCISYRGVKSIRIENRIDFDTMKTILTVDGKPKVFDLFTMGNDNLNVYIIWKGTIYQLY